MWDGKRVLVTGAGGFIGSHLCEALVAAGAEVTAMIHYSSRSDWGNLELLPEEYRKSLKVVAGDIQDSDFVLRQVKGQAVVFHLAALIGIPYSYVAPRSYLRTNIEGTLNVVEAARHFDTMARRSTRRSMNSIRSKVNRPIPLPKLPLTRWRRVITLPLGHPFQRFDHLIPTGHGNPIGP
jgi:nucleoside-diphosphate-sugar epimerase